MHIKLGNHHHNQKKTNNFTTTPKLILPLSPLVLHILSLRCLKDTLMKMFNKMMKNWAIGFGEVCTENKSLKISAYRLG